VRRTPSLRFGVGAWLASGLALALACSSATPPGASGDPAAGGFETLDANRDGWLSREEYRSASARAFAQIDGDGDGVLAGGELGGFPPDVSARLDANQDGRVSRNEFLDSSLRSFLACDANGDDRVSRDEATSCPQRMRSGGAR
jgi:hypothetical protein